MPQELLIDWDAVQLSAVAGVPYPALALKHGMVDDQGRPDTNAIRQRAFREKWPVPAAVRKRARNQHKAAIESQNEARQKIQAKLVTGDITEHPKIPVTVVTGGVLKAKTNEIAAVTITDDLLANGIRGTLAAQRIALRSILDAPDSLPVTSPSDLQSLLKTVRIASGQDKEGTTVNVAIGGGWSEWPEPEVIKDVTDSVTVTESVNWDEF